MKKLLLLLLMVIPLIGHGDSETSSPYDPEFDAFKASSLDLRENLPIDMDISLRASVLNAKQEPLRNQQIIKAKAIPWSAFAALLVVFLVVYYLKRGPKAQAPKKTQTLQSVLSYHDAMQKLESLKKGGKLDPSLVKDFVNQLALSVRYSFEERFQVNAPTKTTQEFLEDLGKDPRFRGQSEMQLKDFLESIDKIKFARYQPSLEECLTAAKTASTLGIVKK